MIEWFDDLVLGMRFESAEKEITREDIKRFAVEFDPQPYHLDEEAAERTPFKGLAASGWHTAAIAMRLAVEASVGRRTGPCFRLGHSMTRTSEAGGSASSPRLLRSGDAAPLRSA